MIMDSLTLFIGSIIAVLAYTIYFFKQKFKYWKVRGVPYIEPGIPFGNLPSKNVHFKDVTTPLYRKKDPNFPFLGSYFFQTPSVICTDLDFVQTVLVKEFSSFRDRGMYVNEVDDPLSMHMFSLDGEKWKNVRAKLTPTFTSGKMKFMFPTVVNVAEQFVEVLREGINKKSELEMKDLLARYTTDVIGTCVFGIECNSLKDPNSEFRRYGARIFDEPLHGPMVQFLMMEFQNFARMLHMKLFPDDVTKFFLQTVRETIDFREKNNLRRNDFMDLLILLKNHGSIDEQQGRNSSGLPFEIIAAQAFLFFVAGFETSSTTMMFSLYELALNPDIQENARREIENVLSNHDGKLTYEAVKEMTYVDQVISESLRKYPPLVNLVRKAVNDFRMPEVDVTIEKGMNVIVPVYAIHHDPEIYSKPDIFDPERFTPDQLKSRHPLSFLSFGDGPRNCVGLRFGRMQSRVGLISLLKNFKFTPSPKTTIPMVFSDTSPILSPLHGMYLEVEKI